MKRKSIVLATLLTIAVVISIVAVPAAAATTYTAIGGDTTFNTYLVVDKDASIPNVTFNYTIAAGTAVAASTTNLEIYAGTNVSNITLGSAAFTSSDSTTNGIPSDSTEANHKYAQKAVTVTFPSETFEKPGVYRYVITQTDPSKPGVNCDSTANRYLDVFVVADPSTNVLSVSKYVFRNVEKNINLDDSKYEDDVDDAASKSVGYTNTVDQQDFKFTKAITGNQGDKNKRFTFTLAISNALPGTYQLELNDVTVSPATITVDAGGTYNGTFNLTNASSVTVKGLNKGAVCTVSEAQQDYTAKYKVDSGSETNGNAAPAQTINTADIQVDFTNTRDGIIPTGIIIAIAPYAIGLCLFGAVVIFMISRKRRQSAEED